MSDHFDLDALEALEKAATPGPWRSKPTSGEDMIMASRDQGINGYLGGLAVGDGLQQNAKFIVALRNAAPELIKTARQLRIMQARFRGEEP